MNMGPSKKLEIEIENIGGFKGIHKFTLAPGLNIIKAPNATGKTSFVKALELATLGESELKNKGHYMNLMADENREKVRIKISNGKNIDRTFRRIQENLKLISGEALYQDGTKVSTVCYAMPDNPLIIQMLAGESIQSFVEEFSDSKLYNKAIELLNSLKSDFDRKHQLFRSDLIRLEQEQENLKNEETEKQKLEKAKKDLPIIDTNKAIEDEKIRKQVNKFEADKRGIDSNIANIRKNLMDFDNTLERFQSDITIYDTRVKEIGKDQKRINDQIEENEKKIRLIETDISEFNDKLRVIDDKLRMVSENFQKRKKYSEDNLCFACGQTLNLAKLQKWDDELKSAKEDFGQQLKKAKRTREDLEDERHTLKRELQELATYYDKLKSAQKSKAEYERKRSIEAQQMKELESGRASLEAQIEKLYANIDEDLLDIVKKTDKINSQIELIDSQLASRKARIAELQKKADEADDIVDKIEFSEQSITHMRRRKEEVIDAVRTAFNKRIIDVYKKLGYKDFEEIEIRPDHTVYIRRPGYHESWPLNALSTSERITLAVMFLIAGKQEYLPDYPFFVLDELVTSYDPERFEKLKDYISNVTDYVVVTQLAKSEDVKGKIVIENYQKS